MYLSNYTADRCKLAFMYVENLRHNWRNLDAKRKDQLLNEISNLLNVQLVEERYESKINKSK